MNTTNSIPTILHEQQGLTIRKNQKNGVVVARLHYTADPAKRESWWIEEAKQGMSDAKYRQEYEIDYTAIWGQKVFDEINTYRDKIICRSPWPQIPEKWPCFAGLDFGMRNPSAFVVFTVLKNSEGESCIHAIWEHYKPTLALSDLSTVITECPWYEQIRWIAADLHLWDKNQTDVAGANTTRFNQLCQLGVRKLIKGNSDEARWMTMMKDHWANLDTSRDSTFKIFDCCPNLIQEFENAKYPTLSEGKQMTQSYKETIMDVDNHAMDATKYFMNAGPNLRPREFKDSGDKKIKAIWKRYRG